VTLRFDSSGGLDSSRTPGTTRNVVTLDLALDYRSVDLRARGLAAMGLRDGTLAAFSATGSWGGVRAFAAGRRAGLTVTRTGFCCIAPSTTHASIASIYQGITSLH